MSDDHIALEVEVNGQSRQRTVPARTTLAYLLREELGLTGTHLGCEQGACGACTVLIDGEPARSCVVLALQVDGCRVETVESLSEHGSPSDLQRRFLEERAFQCGFCTPGFLMALSGIDSAVTEPELDDILSGHICRCTGYEPIVRAARQHLKAQGLLREDRE